MKSEKLGKSTSKVEVENISPHGVWLHAKGKEFFLSYPEFPWFKNMPISAVKRVKLIHNHHLYWDDLDVDMDMDSLEHVARYPLT